MADPRQHIEAAMEAQRFTASQAARERTQLDPISVVYVVQALIEAGRTEEARARWIKFKTTGE